MLWLDPKNKIPIFILQCFSWRRLHSIDEHVRICIQIHTDSRNEYSEDDNVAMLEKIEDSKGVIRRRKWTFNCHKVCDCTLRVIFCILAAQSFSSANNKHFAYIPPFESRFSHHHCPLIYAGAILYTIDSDRLTTY
jgi:hypothetical protein